MKELERAKKDPEVLAVEIRSLQQQAQVVVMSYAVEIGRRLCEAKAVVSHGEWGRWLEEKVQFSQSTAQNYMKMYERYGSEQVSLFGEEKTRELRDLPYTKALKLLAVPEEEMESFLEEHQVAEMSTRELEKAIRERDQARQEAEAWRDTADKTAESARQAEERARQARDSAQALRLRLEELENRPVEVAVEAPSQEMLEEIRAAEAQKYTQEREKLEKKLKKAESQAQKAGQEAEALRAQAEKAQAEARQEIQKEKTALEAEKAQAEARAAELERRLKLADGTTAVFQVYFQNMQENWKSMLQIIQKADQEQGEKLKKALGALVERMGKAVEA